MAPVSTYLNFVDKTEEAFNFYKSVFGGEFGGDGISRFKDIPPMPDMPPVPDWAKNMIMHIELPILGGAHILMGTDSPEGFSPQKLAVGNNVNINLEPDTRTEAKRLFEKLSDGGKVIMPLDEVFWGAYYGHCQDKYGVYWMINCTAKA